MRIKMGILFLLGTTVAWGVDPRSPVEPFEAAQWVTPATPLDEIVQLEASGAGWNRPSSDVVFLRRVYLDVLGVVPEPEEVDAFVSDPAPDKRACCIDRLLLRPEHVDLFSMRWADLLRIKSEFPINLWPNAVQAYHRWVVEAVRENLPYDGFARALLLGAGSNFRQPTANFYRAMEAKNAPTIARTVALTWMGTRWTSFSLNTQIELAKVFARVDYKKTGEWKEEVVVLKPADDPGEARLPDGQRLQWEVDDDPRLKFAEWLTSAQNPWFARVMANRAWAWFFGRGIVEPADDWGPENPVGRSAVLDFLATELVKSRYDLRTMYRLILNSWTYQQSTLVDTEKPLSPALAWSRPVVRRLDAEVLIDALDRLGGSGEVYVSAIPEPFTYTPPTRRSTALADGSMTSPFLMRFGRPSRDTGLASERTNTLDEEQLRYLLNSTEVQKKVAQSPRLQAVYSLPEGQRAEQIRQLYRQILSRPPTAAESTTALEYLARAGKKEGPVDLAWALVNSKEFLFQH